MTPDPQPRPGDDTPPHATTGRTNPTTAAQRRRMAQLNI